MSMQHTLKTMFGLTLLTLGFLLIGKMAGGQAGMVIALMLAVATNFFAYFFSDRIVLAMYGARELAESEAPGLHRMVAELADNAGIPKPKVYAIDAAVPNAFATGRGPGHAAIAVTGGIVGTLSQRELRGVLAHEMGHIVNRDVLLSTLVATLVGALGFLAEMIRWSAFLGHDRDREGEGGGGFAVLLLAIVMPIIALVVQMFISRQREYAADQTGARLSGDPLSLASALERIEAASRSGQIAANPATAHLFIVNPLSGGKPESDSFLSTHPSTANRVARLVETAREMGLAA
jgi:heat shock protein HtpX